MRFGDGIYSSDNRLRAAGFAETAMVNDCERFAFNVEPYNLNRDNGRFSNLRLQIINETMDTSRAIEFI